MNFKHNWFGNGWVCAGGKITGSSQRILARGRNHNIMEEPAMGTHTVEEDGSAKGTILTIGSSDVNREKVGGSVGYWTMHCSSN